MANMASGDRSTMNRVETIETLRSHAPALRQRGISALYLFGSMASDQAGPESDVDLFVDLDPTIRFSLVELLGVREYLGEVLHRRVDVFPREGLHRVIRRDVEQAAIRVF